MSVWEKLENDECYAVAIYNYTPSDPSLPHLPLEVGELVHIQKETNDWYFGRKLRSQLFGAFPKNYVVIRECIVNKCGDSELASSGGGGVAHDIAISLRELLQHWKLLFITNDKRFKFMEVSMHTLLELRAQLSSGTLPQDQLRKSNRTAVFTLDKANRTLDMELAVRNANGQLVNPLLMSTYKLNALHDETNDRIDKNMETTSVPTQVHPAVRTYTISVQVKNFVCRSCDDNELCLSLYDGEGRKLTEHLAIKCAAKTFNAHNVLFTDLGSDIRKEKIFLVCHVVRIGSMDPQVNDHRRNSTASRSSRQSSGCVMRRPFGIACADITKYLAVTPMDKDILLPFLPCEKENMETLLKKILSNRDVKDTKNTLGLWVSLSLVEGDIAKIRKEHPILVVGNVAIARKMGFPEIILPGDARNDLYVTLTEGALAKVGGKNSERTIEVCARVVNNAGYIIKEVISLGAGLPLVDEFTSVVYYHEDRPKWNEVFKVVLDIEKFKEAHLVFLCRHRSSNEAKDRADKYFALSYLTLMQIDGTATPDGTHDLCVYKITHKSSSSAEVERECSAACLGLPAFKDKLPTGAERGLTRAALSLSHRDVVTVSTSLCSTKLTQREEILGVLKWSTRHSEDNLRAALKKLLDVPNEELVKFLQDILDAMFSILTQIDEKQPFNDDSYAVLVLKCLLTVLSLVSDHKYQHFQPVLKVYIDSSFCDAVAYEKLITVVVWVITVAERDEPSMNRLYRCMKCIQGIVQFIVRSRQLRTALGDTSDTGQFVTLFENFLDSIVWLMNLGANALTCQGAVLKYFPQAVPHIVKVFPANQLCVHFVKALDVLPLSKLSNQRMHSLLELVQGPLGTDPLARAILLPHVANTIASMLKENVELDRNSNLVKKKAKSADKAAKVLGADTPRFDGPTESEHNVDICVETLGEVVTLLAREDVGPVDDDRNEFFRRLLPTILRIAAAKLRDRDPKVPDDPLLRRIVAVLLDFVRQMTEEHYTTIVRALESEKFDDSKTLIAEAIALILMLMRKPIFRTHWADMLHLQMHVSIHALGFFIITLMERLNEPDDETQSATRETIQLWFEACGKLATARELQLENISVSRRQRVLNSYGDMRLRCANLISQAWYSLGEHKRYLIPYYVGMLLEVSFLRDDEVRNTVIPIFFDMMQTEYEHNVARGITENLLKDVENELIDKLDVLTELGCGDAAWRAKFVSICGVECSRAREPFRQISASLVAAAARQFDTLLEYRSASLKSGTPHRMHLTTRVLHFYEQIERPHMYIRYVHKLADMHRSAGQWVEAGLSLRLHATLLRWEHDKLSPRLYPPMYTDEHPTHRQLKEALYCEVAELLNKGQQWELAVQVVKDLVSVYEEEALGYGPLSKLHSQLAELYMAMLTTPRSHPGYFRVIYYGKGFPSHMRVPHGFIYRGNEYEQVQNFRDRLLDEWPDAEILNKLDTPGEEITESNGQYLLINAVEPCLGEKLKRLSGKPIAEQTYQYYKHNNVGTFTFSRSYIKEEADDDSSQKNEFAKRWIERTELEISDKLPGILRWFPVVKQRTYSLSPIEAAVELLTETNRELKSLALDARSETAPLQPLSMRLSGILDPAVQGGIKNYENAFFNSSYAKRHPESEELLEQLRSLIQQQIPLLKFGLEVHKSRAPPIQEQKHSHMVSCFKQMRDHVHQRYGRQTIEKDIEWELAEVQLRTPTQGSLHARNGEHRISDVSSHNDSAVKSRFLNALSRNSSGGVASYFNTLQNSPKRREKKRIRKSEVTTTSGSQWYTSNTCNGNVPSVNNNPISIILPATNYGDPCTSPLRELRQELATERPLRSEVEREKRLSSQRASYLTSSTPPSNRDSIGTTDSNQEDEEPPPLPLKTNHRNSELDCENNNGPEFSLQRNSYDTVWAPRGSFLYSSLAGKRSDFSHVLLSPPILSSPTVSLTPPPPPPKKRNPH